MDSITITCDNLKELYNQVQQLETTSVIHFEFGFTVILSMIFLIFYIKFCKPKSIWKCLMITSFVFYILNVIRLVFFPIPINPDYIEILKREAECGILTERRHNLELFDFMKWDNLFHITTVGNFLLLLPLSFYFPILFKKYRWNFISITFIGFVISLSIESLQLTYDLVTGYAYRGFNVDDLMMNTLGIFWGYVLYLLVKMTWLIINGLKKIFV